MSNADWVARVRKLEEEVAGLRRALRSRGLIEQAKGILAREHEIDPEQAFKRMSLESQKRNVAVADLAADIVAGLKMPAPPRRGRGTPPGFARHLQRAVSSAASTVSLPELAATLWQDGLVEAGADGVAVMAVYDTEQRLVASAGNPGPDPLVYPLETANGRILLQLSFSGPLADDEQAAVSALAGAVGGIASRMWCPPAIAWDQLQWMREVLGTVYGQGKLLSPVRDDNGQITDFTVDYATKEVTTLFGRSLADLTGARLLDLEPHLASNGVFDGYVEAYEKGVAFERPASYETVLFRGRPRRLLLRRRAFRVADHLLVSQQHLDAAQRQNEYVARMEVLGSLGFAEWDLASGEISWSPGFYRLFGRDLGEGPSAWDRLPVDSEELRQLRSVAGTADVVLQLTHADGTLHWLRMLAESKAIDSGEVHLIQAVATDITEEKVAEETLRRTEAALAGQRLRVATERELTRQMREMWYPASTLDLEVPGLHVRGVHWVPPEHERVQADFLDAIADPDGSVLMCVGDIIGSGLMAAATMTRLMYPARVMARDGAEPAEILAALNTELLLDPKAPMASMVIARFSPDRGTLTWAQAGHLAPVLVRSGKANQLTPPRGVLLGLTESDFESEELDWVPGDLLILFTDGIASGYRSQRNPMGPLLKEMQRHALDGGPGALVERFMAAADSEACILTAQAV
ncbi:SpoIIE family protein phosphatase [Catelliglobosispora koreensis]|uniref:SpoIIE family protein phosphatase n=1 Tax=Catelliglobosispora koreensis TaxID=129052 RepID=UPI00036D1D09|nr:SpoIIE family protein phosphatase [Catelliglobosispora koreensis]